MSSTRRREALTGPAFAVLALGGNLLQGSVPSVHEEASRAVGFYTGASSRIAIGMAIALLGVMLLIWFVSVLRDAIDAAGTPAARLGSIAYGGGLVGAALLAAGLALNAAGALRAYHLDTISEDVAAVLFDGSFVLMGLASAAGLAVAMIATGIAAIRHGVLPRWVGWLSLVLALPGVVAPVAWLLLLLFPLWAALVGVLLYRRGGAAGGAAAVA